MSVRRTKIVCTIGPSSSKKSMLERLLHAGMDVARLNFSHGDFDWHAKVIAELRALSEKNSKPLAILQDLSGPKIRMGELHSSGVELLRGDRVGFTEGDTVVLRNEEFLLPLPVPELLRALQPGKILLLDDGKITLRVVQIDPCSKENKRVVWAKCISGGTLHSRKGVTAPGVQLALPSVTEKDIAALKFGLEHGVDWVAVSFVRSVEDLEPIFETIKEKNSSVPVLAKIEKAEAVQNFDSILRAVDGIMVARGDLGVEMDFDEVPIVQKRLIRACNKAAKPVITATQMLESMMNCPRPTRAEAADVANAILDGSDAVMLSGETASGQFPIESVKTMSRIALRTEKALFQEPGYASRFEHSIDITAAVGSAATEIAKEIGAKAILCATTTGGTVRQTSSHRPPMTILGVTPDHETYRRLALIWGVQPCLIDEVDNTDSMMSATLEAAEQNLKLRPGDRVVLTAGVPVNEQGTTNLIRVHTIGRSFDGG